MLHQQAAPELLTRDEFRNRAFARSGGKCVVCRAPATEVHHIVERRLWVDGGYYDDNAAPLCSPCHVKAEQTLISCEALREKAGITKTLLPEHLYQDQVYTKWGDPVLPNGMRTKGELFYDSSVQQILAPVLSLYTNRVRHPRTYHLPWSLGATDDDKVMTSLDGFLGREVVVTVKVDGECTTLYSNYLHARSPEYHAHSSRDWVKALHAKIAHDIPPNYRVCGENLFAKHSIYYQHLPDYFLVHSVWDDQNVCLSWDETTMWAELLGLKTVPVLWRGRWDEDKVRSSYSASYLQDECEGYVVRVAQAFPYRDYRLQVGKFVRANHVQTHAHWLQTALIRNETQ